MQSWASTASAAKRPTVGQELLTGVVKSWNGSKGFGFITCEQVAGDVFFSRNELPAEAREVRGTFLEGRNVAFEAIEDPEGRVKATTVQILASDGEPLAGIIKSYSEQNRYGFVTSSSLGDDARFQSTDLPPMTQGANLKGKLVTFDVQQLPDGKLRVKKMKFQTSKIAATVAAFSVGYGGLAALPAAPLGSGLMTGVVKSFSDRHGYGFINTPGHPVDIKFGKADLICETVTAGTWVSFLPALVPDGRVQAKQVQVVTTKRPGGPAAPTPVWNISNSRADKLQRQAGFEDEDGAGGAFAQSLAPPGQILSGTVKSYMPSKGFGFVTCVDVDGDVYFMRRVLPVEAQLAELKGQAVTFELGYAPDGKLRAQSVTLV